MRRIVEVWTGFTGYRHQLDRARRYLAQLEAPQPNSISFQDALVSFFHHCWHIKDWLHNDPAATIDQKANCIDLAHASDVLDVCQDLCNRTKLLGARPGATLDHTKVTLDSDRIVDIDGVIKLVDGSLMSAKQLARHCIAEWERILQSQGLTTARLS
jgi:hypothetical protein